jgi:transposase
VTIKDSEPAPGQDTALVMLGIEGVAVTGAEREADGRLTVWAKVTALAACPECGTVSEKVHQYVVTAPRDVRVCGEDADFYLVKRRMECAADSCPRGTFTEWVPQLPPRCAITRRLLEHAGAEVAGRGITPAESARRNGISWPSVHGAFATAADELLGDEPAPVAHLGIDEHRRGRPRWRHDTDTGEYVQLADRWHTCFYDLSGQQGMLGQVEGRTSDDAAYWLAGATPAWRDAVQVVAIDMCTIYLSAVRRMPPRAKVTVDLFHVVQLAVKTVGDVRRRAIREKYGRRGRAGDPEYGIKHLLERNLETLSPDDFAKIIDTLDASAEDQQVALAWIAKEKLRDALNLRARVTGSTPCERQVRDKLFSFYDWCGQHEQVTELAVLAATISRWEEQIATAVTTGVTNATSESLNRLAKLEARLAYGFRNPANQRRRVRIACTRGARRKTATPRDNNTKSNHATARPRLTSKALVSRVVDVRVSGSLKLNLRTRRSP